MWKLLKRDVKKEYIRVDGEKYEVDLIDVWWGLRLCYSILLYYILILFKGLGFLLKVYE